MNNDKPGKGTRNQNTRPSKKKWAEKHAHGQKQHSPRDDGNRKQSGTKHRASSSPGNQIPGLETRELALKIIFDVLGNGRAFDEARHAALESKAGSALSGADKGLARLIAATVLRLKPVLDKIIDVHLERPLPNRYQRIRTILLCASAQLLILKTPPHAAINLAVEQAQRSNRARHLASLVNAVLRKISTNGPQLLAQIDVPKVAIPAWLWSRWENTYGEETARNIAIASLNEPSLDLTIKSDPESWRERLNATRLVTPSLRHSGGGRIEQMEGFKEGGWWVQDAAAALPALLLGDVRGASVADLCAAPGGKTAQLANMGANVTAVDSDLARLERVKKNLTRLDLKAECVDADVTTWKPQQKFDFVLLDAPCTATGTIRRHPDILHLKREDDIAALAIRQREMLNAAYELLSTTGTLIFCTCSLEPEEGVMQIQQFLADTPSATHSPILSGEAGIKPEWLTNEGHLRTLPFHDPRTGALTPEVPSVHGGMDGFFAARINRTG